MRSTFWLLAVLFITSGASFAGGAWITGLWEKSSLSSLFVPFEPRNVLTVAVAHRANQQNDTLITEPDDGTAPLLDLLRNASSSVELVMYEFNDPDVEQALAQATSRGISVRVLLNKGYYGVPSKSAPNEDAYEYLKAHHVPVEWTSSAFALTHEKSLVIDNEKALIMTFNLNAPDYTRSRDFGLIDTDSKDVRAMVTTFNADWKSQPIDEQFGDGLIWSPKAKDDMVSAISGAKKSLDIYNEELEDPDIVQALATAQSRGVSVRLLMTYSSLWKKELAKLQSSGVQVRTYPDNKTAPLYVHAKTMVIDGTYVCIGSQNFSSTSLTKSRELGIVIDNPGIVHQLTQTFASDWSLATP